MILGEPGVSRVAGEHGDQEISRALEKGEQGEQGEQGGGRQGTGRGTTRVLD